MVLDAPLASAALSRYGPRRTAITGQILLVVGIAGLSRIETTNVWAVTGATFAVLGAGFATVVVTATGTAVGDAPPGYSGDVGGLKQTAMHIGPTSGVAIAADMILLRSSAVGSPVTGAPPVMSAPALGSTLLVLAGLAALGLLPASLLPAKSARPVRRATTAPADHDVHAAR